MQCEVEQQISFASAPAAGGSAMDAERMCVSNWHYRAEGNYSLVVGNRKVSSAATHSHSTSLSRPVTFHREIMGALIDCCRCCRSLSHLLVINK